MKRLVFTVTNELNYDQRMIRICTSLVNAGFNVLLIGVKRRNSPTIAKQCFGQKRVFTFFKKGFGFYAEYNFRLFFTLLFTKADLFCCIDLDTMLPVWMAAKLRGKKKVYDAHEFFSQQKEIVTRPTVHRVWKWIENSFVPKFKYGYTVNGSIALEFYQRYKVNYEVIRNLPVMQSVHLRTDKKEKIILYQGAVNEARGLEYLVPAMKEIESELHIYGDGNFLQQTKNLIAANNLEAKVFLKGKLLPAELDDVTQNAYIGLNLVENNGLNQYYSLANKFFDYIQNGIPQVSMNFPEYKKVNDEFKIAVLIDDLQPMTISTAINELLSNDVLHTELTQNCLTAREQLNWQQEEKKLVTFYKNMI